MKTLAKPSRPENRHILFALGFLAVPLAQAGTTPQVSILTGAGPGGGPNVKRFDFQALQAAFHPRAYPGDASGGSTTLPGSSIAIDEPGVHLAIADLDNDGRADLLTSTLVAGPGGGPHVRFYKQPTGGTGVPPALAEPFGGFTIPASAQKQHYTAVGTFSDGTSRIITGAGAGGGPHVKIFSPAGSELASFAPYGETFSGGIRVAAGDVDGDGAPDIITAAAGGGGPHVKVFSGNGYAELHSFAPFPVFPAGGINVAAGDLDGDGKADIVVSPGSGGPHVKVFKGSDFVSGLPPVGIDYYPFGGLSTGGVRVAVGDVDGDGLDDLFAASGYNSRRRVEVLKSNKQGDPNANREIWTWTGSESVTEGDPYEIAVGDLDGDGKAEIVTGGKAARALVWSPRSNATLDFDAYPAPFAGGVTVASGDVNGDGTADLITGTGSIAPHVKVFDGRTGAEIRSFFAYPGFAGGVNVASGDLNGDGVFDIITGAGAGGSPHVKVFDGLTGAELRSFFSFDQGFTGGVNVASGDLDGDGRAEIITGAGPGAGPHVKVFDGATGLVELDFFAFDPTYTGGVFVGADSVSGLLLPAVQKRFSASRMVGGGPGGGPHVKVFDGVTGAELAALSPFGSDFIGGITVSSGDVDGDGVPELLAGASPVGSGPTVVGLDRETQAVEFRHRLTVTRTTGRDLDPGAPPFFAAASRPQRATVIHPPVRVAEGIRFTASGTPGTWLDFETSDDLLNWLPYSSDYIPDAANTQIGQVLPIIQKARFVRAASK